MDFKDNQTIFSRFNDALYDIVLAEKELRKENSEGFLKHSRDAGEAMSQSLEYALKNHLLKKLTFADKKYFSVYDRRTNLFQLITKFVEEDGTDGDYFYTNLDEGKTPTVNFKFLLHNKSVITNDAKHSGKVPDFEIQKTYLEEVRNFITQYINIDADLKSFSDFEKIDLANWDTFYSACDRFLPQDRNLILIIGSNKNIDKSYFKNLSLPDWKLIVDFDYESESNGFYKSVYSDETVSPHILKASDTIAKSNFSIYNQSHYHFYANNFKGSGVSEVLDYTEWNKKFGKNIDKMITAFSETFSNQKNIVLVLHNSRRHVNIICEKLQQHLGGHTTFVFANDLTNELEQVSQDFGIKIDLSIPEISEGLGHFSSNFGKSDLNSNDIRIPFAEKSVSDTTGMLSENEFSQLEEHFELFHLGLPNFLEIEEDKRDFFMGKVKLSPYGLKYRYDVERQNFRRRYIKPIEKVIENGKGKINIVHEAGYGGTTVARRIAWELHTDYPTLILKKYKDIKVKELLITLHEKTRKSIVVVMETPQSITVDEIDSLYRSIPPARPIILIIVKRGKINNNDLSVSDWGNDVPDLISAYKPYLENYGQDVKIRKEKELDNIIFSNNPDEKTPFYIGLLTFEENFHGLKDYINNFAYEVKDREEQRQILLYLAMCDNYLGQGLPANFFSKLLKTPSSEVITLENYFNDDSSIVSSLLSSYNEGNTKFWKIRHIFFSKELKTSLLSGNSQNQEIWRQGLSDISVKFIQNSNNDAFTSNYIEEILQKLFIGTRRDRAGEDFTTLINDIPTMEGKEEVFNALKEEFPDNPHYYSHLARFYAYKLKNNEKAIKHANEAIRLSEMEGATQDSLLYHIKGMCLRANIYDTIDKHINRSGLSKSIDKAEYDEIILKDIPESAYQFEISRKIAKSQNRIDEYGFIAHIQLLIRAIDYGIIVSGKSKSEFLEQNPEPFSEWLDLSESLLEEVKRINSDDDESGKILDCDTGLLSFYEDYSKILQNLRNRLDRGINSERVRRQIVRTHIRKGSNYHLDNTVVNTILSLMEQNIINEPDNEINFYLWFQAARYSKVTLDEAINKISKWKVSSSSIDAIYYFYILKVIRALEGYSDAAVDAEKLISDCKSKGKSNITIYEWLGRGTGLSKLVSRKEISLENKGEKLQKVKGYFTDFQHDGSAFITIADTLKVFFNPTQAKLTSSDRNKEVEFYLGFSYDGLRADSFSVALTNSVPTTNVQENQKSKSRYEDHKVLENRFIGQITDLKYYPNYKMGTVETEDGKEYFFHKDNEDNKVFEKLSLKSWVSFSLKINGGKQIAFNLSIIDNFDS